jgi:sulfate adenylyltransferase subunit 1
MAAPFSPLAVQTTGHHAVEHRTDRRGAHEHEALRFMTAGSVDDGKSTLIGRLLLDSRAILADQLDALQRRAAGAPIDLSLLTDGLEAEREQGITIDVAYRYFATPQRKFIIADAPGHEQYTRNMVTAAAGSDAAVVLIDITKLDASAPAVQLLPQTRRHSLLAKLLRVPSIVFAVNKLDAAAHAQQAFSAVQAALLDFAEQAGIRSAGVVPVCALRGDNVAIPSAAWDWYRGPTLLQLLEGLPATAEAHGGMLLLPVQYVARQGGGAGHQPRTLWGRIVQGRVRAGDQVGVFPGGQTARVAELRRAGAVVDACGPGRSAGLVLDRQLDVSRGDWIVAPGAAVEQSAFDATLAWLDTEPAMVGRRYWVRHGHRWSLARITAITSRLDIHTLADTDADALAANEIGRVRLQLQQPLPLAAYRDNRVAGALIVVDPSTHRTSGALLVDNVRPHGA